MPVPTIQKVIEGKTVKTERKSKEIVDNFDRQTIRFVIHIFYAENMLPSAKMIQKDQKRNTLKYASIAYKNINLSDGSE